MTRRGVLLLLVTSRDRANRHCARAGRTRERRGLTDRERTRLRTLGCKQEGGAWMSDRVWEA